MTDQSPQGRLLEHYAATLADADDISLDTAIDKIDASGPEMYVFLGRMSDNDELNGYSLRYVELRALHLAGIATEDELIEWAELRAAAVLAESENLGDDELEAAARGEATAGDYDKEAAPLVLDASDGAQEQLMKLLWQLRRIQHAQEALDRQREELLEEAVPLQRGIGRPVTLIDPLNGEPLVAGVRQSERLTVPYAQLAAEIGELAAREVCKPLEVDTKQDGLFVRAVERGEIPHSVVARVARYKASTPYIGFSSPVKKKR